MTAGSNGSVRVEILAREDCPNRGMAIIVVERVVDETGIPAEIEVVEVASDEEAEEYRVLGSPTVLVDGRDVDPEPLYDEFSADDRIYRTPRGPCGLARGRVDPRRAPARRRADDLQRRTSVRGTR